MIKILKIKSCLRLYYVIEFCFFFIDWNKDYKPGPYPKTEEERIIAAEKYGIPISEYKPYPDDGQGYGDYPDLPLESAESKDPFYPWDNPELKRNFNETVSKLTVLVSLVF